MHQEENSINKNIFNQISKKGLIENHKKILITKLGFRNLSYSKMNLDTHFSNNNYSIHSYSSSSFIKEKRTPFKESSHIKLNTIQKINNIIKKQNSHNKNNNKNYISSISLKKRFLITIY